MNKAGFKPPNAAVGPWSVVAHAPWEGVDPVSATGPGGNATGGPPPILMTGGPTTVSMQTWTGLATVVTVTSADTLSSPYTKRWWGPFACGVHRYGSSYRPPG